MAEDAVLRDRMHLISSALRRGWITPDSFQAECIDMIWCHVDEQQSRHPGPVMTLSQNVLNHECILDAMRQRYADLFKTQTGGHNGSDEFVEALQGTNTCFISVDK
jgi:hypothetical protein